MHSNSASDHARTLAQRLARLCSREQPVIDVYLTADMIALVRRLRGEPWFAALTERLYNDGFSVVFKTEPD
jgi:hypothetical protein